MWNPAPESPTLAPNEIHIWRVALDVTALEMRRLRRTLSADELARAARFHFHRDRRRFIAARGALRNLLAKYLKQAPSALRFSYGPWGKPSLLPPNDLRFNLSHSHDLALYAVSGREVGIDLERIDGRFGGEPFFVEWTQHEASLKAGGMGLLQPESSAAGDWLIQPVPVGSEYAAALASPQGSWRILLWDWSSARPPVTGPAERETRTSRRDGCS